MLRCFRFILTTTTLVRIATAHTCAYSFTTLNMSGKAITSVEPMSFPMATLDPFLFCVYHLDHYPAGDSKMRAPRRGNGADFNPSAPYRMYHGDDMPGFPQHPHRGFETITATLQGTIDHTDSAGNAGRYGGGDVQWMTAGKGVVHGEMFPLIHTEQPNPLKLFQIWLNLPKKNKMVNPGFAMHWAEELPRYTSPDSKVALTVWAGELQGLKGLPPAPDSYANDPRSEIGIWFFVLQPGGTYTIPAATSGNEINRRLYFIEGEGLTVAGESVAKRTEITVQASHSIELTNKHESQVVEVLVMQGRPLKEPVAQRGPFVMNSMEEIQQAYADYSRTQFGGWPWPKDAMFFPKEKGRFALLNGKEIYPPSK